MEVLGSWNTAFIRSPVRASSQLPVCAICTTPAHRKERRWKFERDATRAMHVAAERAREWRREGTGGGLAQGVSFYAREEKRSAEEMEVFAHVSPIAHRLVVFIRSSYQL